MSTAARGEPLVSIPSGRVLLEGILELPPKSCGVVMFSHGSGSGRRSPRNRYVAQKLLSAELGTLPLDLLTPEEGQSSTSDKPPPGLSHVPRSRC